MFVHDERLFMGIFESIENLLLTSIKFKGGVVLKIQIALLSLSQIYLVGFKLYFLWFTKVFQAGIIRKLNVEFRLKTIIHFSYYQIL